MKIRTKLIISFIAISVISGLLPITLQNGFSSAVTGNVINNNSETIINSFNISIFTIIISSIIGLVIAIYISNSILKPVKEVSTNLNQLKYNKPLKSSTIKGNNEITDLKRSYNSILKRHQTLNKNYENIKSELHIIQKIKEVNE